MKLLSFECSAKAASCAVTEDGKVLGSVFSNVPLTHSQTLMPMAENLLSSLKLKLADIGGFAVAAGPGSFTGIRIGISAVKGLAAMGDIPCYPVSTLNAMAHLLYHENAVICPVMDARCNQVYNALFSAKDGVVRRLCEDRAITIDELSSELMGYERRIILIGDGADLVFSKLSSPYISCAPEHLKNQNALGVAFAAKDAAAVSPRDLGAYYLRLPQAERELKKRSNDK